MAVNYLVRFDDITPTMNWCVWDRIESLLDKHRVRPIVAVVPCNKDGTLSVSDPNPYFWSRVREWQSKGWGIGVHGYQHLFHTTESGLIGLQARSEFAGLPLKDQSEKLKKAIAIFHNEGVSPDIWVAPAHSFDVYTIEALLSLGITSLSDGLFPFPQNRFGMFWVPQQMWRFRKMPSGVWTVCLHVNDWGDVELTNFKEQLIKYKSKIRDFSYVKAKYGSAHPTLLSRFTPLMIRGALRFKRSLKSVVSR